MKKLLFSLLAVILLFEEWLWDILTFLGQQLARLLHLARFELWLRQTSPPIALIALAIPIGIVTPLNLAALWLLTKGMVMQGVLIEIVAKLLGTLLVARVFALTKPQLLSFGWIAWIYTTINRWLQWAHQRIVDTAVYRLAQRVKTSLRIRLQAWRNSHGL